MGHEGVTEPSAHKVHPFFTKCHPSDLAAVSPGQSFVLENVRDSANGSRHSTPAAKRHKSHRQSSHSTTHNAEASNSGQAHDVLAVSQIQPEPDRYVTRRALPHSTRISTRVQVDCVTPERPPMSFAPGTGGQPGASGASTPMTKDSKSTNTSSGRKVLKFNMKTGTLGSPPRVKQKKSTLSRVVCLRYGKNEINRREMGLKITQILNGELLLPMIPMKTAENDTRPADATPSSTKTTHPFFTGKSKPSRSSTPTSQPTDSATKSPSRKHSVFTSTPMSPRKPKNPFISIIQNRAPQSGFRSGGTKVPGAKYPMWPPKGMSHVRGDAGASLTTTIHQPCPVGHRKSKGQVTTIGQTESVLTAIMKHVDVEALRGSLPRDEDSFIPAPAELRIPQRHFESGLRLQHRIRPQLSISSPLALAGEEDVSQDELAGPAPAPAHPAISRHYVSLVRELSAFDRSTCESVAWSHKYAPVSAAQVLQKGKDAIYIKHWLEAMKVQSVDTGINESASDKNKAKADVVVPKKRRKKYKEDDFIVDTDDEASDLEEILDDGDDDDTDTDFWQGKKKSVVRPVGTKSREAGRLRNTIVLSGPHGCGKTAAVYAVAKELGFEVFEINSSSRRNGKDVLERIGDMTRNHLVQPHRGQATTSVADDDASDGTTAGHESRSSKQGIMTTFFKAKSGSKEKSKPCNNLVVSKTQKQQSLILVEEADILYEEDKQLWTTLMGMINQSKRPFVITCNDESLIPLQSLNLHGIFRFTPAPTPLAVDLCILIAAHEGHALRRGAVEALYQSRSLDLRATICDLNFWCQIGVGDRKGGFDWFYSRWPKGCDLDERGDVVRVISQDTYRHGMGWLGRDAVLSERSGLDREREVLQQAWDFWHVDMGGDWCQSADMSACAKDMGRAAKKCREQQPESQQQKRQKQKTHATALEALDDFYLTQSDADLFSGGIFAAHLKEKMDPSLPKMSSRAREDFIIGRSLLDAQELSFHTTHGQSMSLALKSEARRRLLSASQRILEPGEREGDQKRDRKRDREGGEGDRGRDKARLHCAPLLDEPGAIAKLDASFGNRVQDMTRMDIAYAFDPIAVAPKAQATSHLEPSVFDRTMRLIVVDVAPWVRGIVAFEHQLMRERQKLNSLLSEGGTRKRMRNTRSAYSALEGGERRSTRKERYFGDALTTSLVMRTGGGQSWQDAVAAETMGESQRSGSVQDDEMDVTCT
ncbi:hypothetical protein E4U43_002458 [Claviceps pusilla]|uniref:ATPase AAA-type core domain-containing protein n=1 Tax=Claviceps pusilla TaxID=123648 RepID=A0A9P7N7H6_9HYPO|nr:hypothetical protein E4U43_002458 [Claviceps pusilla]